MNDTDIRVYTTVDETVAAVEAEYLSEAEAVANSNTAPALLTSDGFPWPVDSTVVVPMTGLPDGQTPEGQVLIDAIKATLNPWFPVKSVELNENRVYVLADRSHSNAPVEFDAGARRPQV